MKPPFFCIAFVLMMACKKETQTNYPFGISNIGTETYADCVLDNCDPNRTTILKAKDVIGTIGGGTVGGTTYGISLSVPGTLDSYVTGVICDLPEAFKKDGLKVLFSGEYKTGCGRLVPSTGGEEIYFLHLTQIDSI